MNTAYHIKVEEKTGRGLYANYDLKENVVLAFEELLVLNPDDSAIVNGTDLQYYTFVYNDIQDCLVLGSGELYNHSDNPNVAYRLVENDGRMKMAFFALREIKRGEQLFIDYALDMKVDPTLYTINLMGTHGI